MSLDVGLEWNFTIGITLRFWHLVAGVGSAGWVDGVSPRECLCQLYSAMWREQDLEGTRMDTQSDIYVPQASPTRGLLVMSHKIEGLYMT